MTCSLRCHHDWSSSQLKNGCNTTIKKAPTTVRSQNATVMMTNQITTVNSISPSPLQWSLQHRYPHEDQHQNHGTDDRESAGTENHVDDRQYAIRVPHGYFPASGASRVSAKQTKQTMITNMTMNTSATKFSSMRPNVGTGVQRAIFRDCYGA